MFLSTSERNSKIRVYFACKYRKIFSERITFLYGIQQEGNRNYFSEIYDLLKDAKDEPAKRPHEAGVFSLIAGCFNLNSCLATGGEAGGYCEVEVVVVDTYFFLQVM